MFHNNYIQEQDMYQQVPQNHQMPQYQQEQNIPDVPFNRM